MPDAILSISDEQAIGILHSALDAGVNVPEDLQILSFNNTFSRNGTPTTI